MKKTLGLLFISTLVLGIIAGCGNDNANKPAQKAEAKQEEKKDKSQVQQKKEGTPANTQTSNQTSTQASNQTTTQASAQTQAQGDNQPKQDTVFGTLDKNGLTKENDQEYRDTTGNQNILYLVAGDTITQVEVNLDPKLGINMQMDKDVLTQHAFDYIAPDATLIQTKDDTDFVYQSQKLGKKYDVSFVSDGGDNVITRVIVSEHME